MAKQYLTWVGWILVILGILGFVWPGVDAFSLSGGENWAHLVLGVIALIAAYWLDGQVQKWLVAILGIVALYVGIWGFVDPTYYGSASLELLDNVVHIVLGVWGLWAAFGKRG